MGSFMRVQLTRCGESFVTDWADKKLHSRIFWQTLQLCFMVHSAGLLGTGLWAGQGIISCIYWLRNYTKWMMQHPTMLLSPNFIHVHHPSSTFIHFVHFNPLLSSFHQWITLPFNFIRFDSISSTSIDSHPLSSSFIWFLSIFIHFP